MTMDAVMGPLGARCVQHQEILLTVYLTTRQEVLKLS